MEKGQRVIYQTNSYSFSEELFILRGGKKKKFYLLSVGGLGYWISEEEGKFLEEQVTESYAVSHCEGIELTLSEFSSCRQSERIH